MSTVAGRYVATFAEASHALPEGMHMNADYPFMLPRVVKLESRDGKRFATLTNGRDEVTIAILARGSGQNEYGYLDQSSAYERLFNCEPHRFKMHPFKDDRTPAVEPEPSLGL